MFDLKRFGRLAAAEWVERRREWGWFLLALVILHFIVVLLMLANENGFRALSVDGQESLFLTGLFISAPVFAARHFQSMARPGAELVALMRPASTFEKWLLAVLVVAVAFPIAYHLVFLVCDVPAVLIAQGRAAEELARELAAKNENRSWLIDALQPEKFVVFFATPMRLGWSLLGIALSITALQAFAMAGSLLFRRSPFLKTLLAGFVVVLLIVLIATTLDTNPDRFFGYWSARRLTEKRELVFLVAWLLIPLLTWTCALRALREREAA